MKTITVDTNGICQHHARELHDLVAGKQIVLPGLVIEETMNGVDWRDYAPDDLARLAPYIDHIVEGDDLTRMLRNEISTGYPSEFKLKAFGIDEEMKRIIALCANDREAALRYFEPSIAMVRSEMERRRDQVFQSRMQLDTATAHFFSLWTDDEIDAAEEDYTLIPAMLKKARFFACCQGMMKVQSDRKGGRIKPDFLARLDCAFARLNLALFMRFIYMRHKKSNTNLRPTRLLANHHDLAFIVMGTYTDELLTHDEIGQKIDMSLRHALGVMYDDGRLQPNWWQGQ